MAPSYIPLLSPSQLDATAVTPSHRRLTFLDAVRGLAALTVLAQHYLSMRYPAFDAFARGQLNVGQVGVVAFFLASGFIVPVSLQKSTESMCHRPKSTCCTRK